jgi:hypothetical protein
MERALKGRPQCAQKDAVVILSSETVGGLSFKPFAEESLQVREIVGLLSAALSGRYRGPSLPRPEGLGYSLSPFQG